MTPAPWAPMVAPPLPCIPDDVQAQTEWCEATLGVALTHWQVALMRDTKYTGRSLYRHLGSTLR